LRADYELGGAGAVLRVNPRNGAVETVASGPPFDNPAGIAVVPPRCGGKSATLVGTTGKDRIKGSRFRDVIATLGGRDTVNGAGGGDLICGGKGPDRLRGSGGRDRLIGGAGDDACVGGAGRDRAKGCEAGRP